MELTLRQFLDLLPQRELTSTAVLVAIVIGVRWLVRRLMQRSDTGFVTEDRRRLQATLRNALLLLLLIGLAFIWATELRSFALSITAFAVAIIIATKELILCVSGTVLKASSNAFRVGDWIDVNGIRGEVVDQTVMATTIQEIHSAERSHEFTGRTVVIPNSMFLTATVRNENFLKKFSYHSFAVTVPASLDPMDLRRTIRQRLLRETDQTAELARRYNASVERKLGIDLMDVGPKIRIATTNEGHFRIEVTAFLPTREAVAIEQRVLEPIWQRIVEEQAMQSAGEAPVLTSGSEV